MFSNRILIVAWAVSSCLFLLGPCLAVAQEGQVFANVASIPVPPLDDFSATYEAATGNVYIVLGEGVQVLVIEAPALGGAPFLSGNGYNNTPLGFPAQIETSGIGWLAE